MAENIVALVPHVILCQTCAGPMDCVGPPVLPGFAWKVECHQCKKAFLIHLPTIAAEAIKYPAATETRAAALEADRIELCKRHRLHCRRSDWIAEINTCADCGVKIEDLSAYGQA